jgi:hypothetical protein
MTFLNVFKMVLNDSVDCRHSHQKNVRRQKHSSLLRRGMSWQKNTVLFLKFVTKSLRSA